MIINSVLLDKKRYKLVDKNYNPSNNIFTVIVGSNGQGKSRLLKKIVNNVKNAQIGGKGIPNNYSRQVEFELHGSKLNFYAPSSESKSYVSKDKINIEPISKEVKVIAVTTTPFDKFPVEYKGNEIYRYHDDYKYHYIGLKISKNQLNQSNYINLLARSTLRNTNVFDNYKLFELLKLDSYVNIQFKSKLPTKERDFSEYNYKTRKFDRLTLSPDFFVNYLTKYFYSIYQNLDEVKGCIGKAYQAYVNCLPYLDGLIDPQMEGIPKDELVYLLDIGLINVSDIIFKGVNGLDMKTSDLSSGQKCMILTLLNIAGSISDNSIVCIDEPEISLHPKWQKEFMKILIEFFNGYKECHFIIATHSPLIISELSKDDCYILNMDLGYAENSTEYKSMSSDYQLAEVFGVAGNNNEYLNRVVVSLLSKLSSKGNLEKEDIVRLQDLVEMSHGMDNTDKVKQLINILDLAWKKVEANAK
ncbi:AAA family ATPase [Vibrio vulnificus]